MNKKKWTYFVTVFFVVLFIYYPSFYGLFQYDDNGSIITNVEFQKINEHISSVFQAAINYKSRYLSIFTLALNYYYSAENVFYYHVVNLIIHLLAGLGLFLMLKELLPTLLKFDRKESGMYLAALTTALWLVAPINTSAVTYIVQRMASMAGMFYFFSFWSYLKWKTSIIKELQTSKRSTCFYLIITLVFFLLGALSKQNIVMLPVMIMLYEYILDSRFFIKKIKYVASFLIIIILFSIYYFFFGEQNLSHEILSQFVTNKYELYEFTPLHRLLLFGKILINYVFQIIFPFVGNFHMTSDIDWMNSTYHIYNYLTLFLISCTVFFIVYSKQNRFVRFCFSWFLINHVLESLIIPLHLVFEHRNYIPSVSILLLMAFVFYKLYVYNKKLIIIPALFIAFSSLNSYLLNDKYKQNSCNALYDLNTTYCVNTQETVGFAVIKLMVQRDYKFSYNLMATEFFYKDNNVHRRAYWTIPSNMNIINYFRYILADYLLYNDINKTKNVLEKYLSEKKYEGFQYEYFIISAYIKILQYNQGTQKIDDVTNRLMDFFRGQKEFNKVFIDPINYTDGIIREIKKLDIDKLNATETYLCAIFLLNKGLLNEGEELLIESKIKGFDSIKVITNLQKIKFMRKK